MCVINYEINENNTMHIQTKLSLWDLFTFPYLNGEMFKDTRETCN